MTSARQAPAGCRRRRAPAWIRLFILGTESDTERDWLTAGQALHRVLLEVTAAGLVASIFSQIVEVPTTRQRRSRRRRRPAGHCPR